MPPLAKKKTTYNTTRVSYFLSFFFLKLKCEFCFQKCSLREQLEIILTTKARLIDLHDSIQQCSVK